MRSMVGGRTEWDCMRRLDGRSKSRPFHRPSGGPPPPQRGGGNDSLIAPKVAAEIEAWLRHLGSERHLSAKTIEAYRRDVLQFLHFLAEHLGGAPSLKELGALAPADVRAFLAARRADDIGSRSLMRALAGIRAFGRYLERNGRGKLGALAAVRGPKLGKTLPRPLPIDAAKRMADPAL